MLTREQKQEVLDLVAESMDGLLPAEKQRRLRAYVTHELPLFADAPWSEIEYTATFMVGVWDMNGSLEAEA
ncbi:MAG: hypothetical protein ABR562_08455 [Thermoplasmatota archaeon]|nr:hypothetical protein [Halobacteriales archaeon]